MPTTTTPPASFAEWTYQHVTDAFTLTIAATVGKTGFDKNRKFVELHDPWDDGDNWVGPGVSQANIALRNLILAAVAPQFTPVDLIGEVLDNVANALLRREASVTFTALTPIGAPQNPDDAEEVAAFKAQQDAQAAEIAAMVEAISPWWDRTHFWDAAWNATRRSRWATRGSLRAWIPASRLVGTGDVRGLQTNLPFPDALAAIALTDPDPSACVVFTHPDTQVEVGLFLFETDGAKSAEVWYVDGETTVVRIVHENSATAQSFSLPMGKRLPIAEMQGKLLITEEVRRQQNRANFFETLLVRVGEMAGFPERYTINAQPTGVWMQSPPANGPALQVQVDTQGVTWYMHAAPRTIGAAITTDLRGVSTEDPSTGKQVISTPGVERFEPTDPDFAIKSCAHARATLLKNCKQGHLANESTAESSGIAYVQARAMFEADLDKTRAPLEGLIRSTIEAVIAMAEHMSGRTNASFLARYRCVVVVHINVGPITPEEAAELRAQVKERLRSRESAMARLGIEDTASEIAAIDQDPSARAQLATVQGTGMAALTASGVSLEGAATFIGLNASQVAQLQPEDTSGGDIGP